MHIHVENFSYQFLSGWSHDWGLREGLQLKCWTGVDYWVHVCTGNASTIWSSLIGEVKVPPVAPTQCWQNAFSQLCCSVLMYFWPQKWNTALCANFSCGLRLLWTPECGCRTGEHRLLAKRYCMHSGENYHWSILHTSWGCHWPLCWLGVDCHHTLSPTCLFLSHLLKHAL